MKLVCVFASAIFSMMSLFAQAQKPPSGPWDSPVSSLAEQAAAILGPGQARLTIRNLSTISIDQIPAIRRLLEQDLKARGVLASGAESANAIRVTLSENARERLWVAEVIQGNETRVAMVHVEQGAVQQAQTGIGLTLRKQAIFSTNDEVLAAYETPTGIVLVEPEQIVIEVRAGDAWQSLKIAAIGQTRSLSRDPRALALPSADGSAFDAYVSGSRCSGTSSGAEWTIHCHESDDPWPMMQSSNSENPTSMKAFYNSARNYFTGVIIPNPGVDLPPFYSAVLFSRADGVALLLNGIDGKVQILANGRLKMVAGTRDWGSDFATLNTVCGAGTEIVASGSGEASADSLRAYELPGREAIPASAPLAMDGTVTALWNAPDRKSLFAVVRSAANRYEVDRVTASCN